LQVVRNETKGKLVREICALTDEGRRHLVRSTSPRQVLEDFVRILEGRQTEVAELADNVRNMQQSLQGMRAAIEEILPHVAEQPPHAGNGSAMNGSALIAASAIRPDDLAAEVKAKLAEWHSGAGGGQDCPLPELYRRLDNAGRVSIGRFHDCLRALHDSHQVYLHPWTGPLYALPEPALALLIGHEIAYYASVR
jgi:hypothetical protein